MTDFDGLLITYSFQPQAVEIKNKQLHLLISFVRDTEKIQNKWHELGYFIQREIFKFRCLLLVTMFCKNILLN